MATQTHRKDHPLSMRLPEADLAIIDRTATSYTAGISIVAILDWFKTSR